MRAAVVLANAVIVRELKHEMIHFITVADHCLAPVPIVWPVACRLAAFGELLVSKYLELTVRWTRNLRYRKVLMHLSYIRGLYFSL